MPGCIIERPRDGGEGREDGDYLDRGARDTPAELVMPRRIASRVTDRLACAETVVVTLAMRLRMKT
jgi:hypothetical protein